MTRNETRRHPRSLMRFIGLAIIGIPAVLIAYNNYLPRPVDDLNELEALVGSRIKINATFEGDYKSGPIVIFKGSNLAVDHAPGTYEMPRPGQKLTVYGKLEIYPNTEFRNEFVIRNATWSLQRDSKPMIVHVYADLRRELTMLERSAIADAMDIRLQCGGCVGLQAGPFDEIYFTVDAQSEKDAQVLVTRFISVVLEDCELKVDFALELQVAIMDNDYHRNRPE